jgi:basic membrane protein A
MNSFNDPTAGKDVATGLYEAGYDVVFACGGQAGLGGFDAVISKPEGNWIIGVDGNQGAYFRSLGTADGNSKADRTITSMQKNVNLGFYDAMKKHLAGTLEYGQNKKLGLDGGFVSFSVTDTTNKVFTADQIAQVNTIVNDIISGKINPGTAFGQAQDWFANFVKSVE